MTQRTGKQKKDTAASEIAAAAGGSSNKGNGRRSRVEPDRGAVETIIVAASPEEGRPDETGGDVGSSILGLFDAVMAKVPEEDLARLPTDLSENHDHYLYGLPKRSR